MKRTPEQRSEEFRIREIHRLNPIREVPTDTISGADVSRMLKLIAAMTREREAQGLTLEELAKRTVVHVDVLARLEAAQSFNPTNSVLFRIACALGKNIDTNMAENSQV